MASLDELSTALRNADAAGDADAARMLAAEITKMRGGSETPAGDIAKSAGAGLGKAAIGLGGMGGDTREAILGVAGAAAGRIAGPKATEGVEKLRPLAQFLPFMSGPTSEENKANVESVTGKFYEPQTTAGRYTERIAEFAPGAALPGGGRVARIASALLGGAGSVAGGDVAANAFGEGARPYGDLAGGVAGGLTPNVLARGITPVATSPERQRLVEVLRNEGVDSLTAGQRTGNKALQYAESILGDAPGAGQGASRIQQEGQRQFTEAAVRRAGTGRTATPEVLADNNARLGREFADLSARNTLNPDNQFINDVVAAVGNYRRVPDSQQRAMVQGYVDDIVGHVNAGGMPGREYQEMRSRLSRQANGLRNSDPTLSEALRDMRNALDNAMRRSISPDDQAAWDQARREYGAQKVLEKSASRAGEATAEGNIVPANLRNTVAGENRGAYARGQGDFAELARAGSAVMAPLPNSGTGQRVAINSIATALGGAAGSPGGVPGAALGALLGAAAPAAAGRALMSAPAQAYIGNTLIDLNRLPPSQRAAAIALLMEGRPALEAPR
jgi:hypothetical protein